MFETLADTRIRFTRVTSCTWIESEDSGLSCDKLHIRLYQFLPLPSLARVVTLKANLVLIDFLASCKQLKSLTVDVPSAHLEYGAIVPGAASKSTTRLSPASGLLEELIIGQGRSAELVHSLASKSSPLCISHLRKLTRASFVSEFDEEMKAFRRILDFCAESLEELTICKHLSPSCVPSFFYGCTNPLLIFLVPQ